MWLSPAEHGTNQLLFQPAGLDPVTLMQELLNRTFNRPRRETLDKADAVQANFKGALKDTGIKKLEK
jgi:hypothetical protein